MLRGIDVSGREGLDFGCGVGSYDRLLVGEHGAAAVCGVDLGAAVIAEALAAAESAFRHLADNVVRLRAAGSVRSKPGRGKPAARAGWWQSVLRPLVGTLRP